MAPVQLTSNELDRTRKYLSAIKVCSLINQSNGMSQRIGRPDHHEPGIADLVLLKYTVFHQRVF